jgi:hypothetical protein
VHIEQGQMNGFLPNNIQGFLTTGDHKGGKSGTGHDFAQNIAHSHIVIRDQNRVVVSIWSDGHHA